MITPQQHEPGLSLAVTPLADWYTWTEQTACGRERNLLNTWRPRGYLQGVNWPGNHGATNAHGQPLVILRDGRGELRACSDVCQPRAGRPAEALRP
jgi:phenylpropionate dioxygenase-like ring-hydroxylating dioxygenase large terminal subunit